MKIQIIKGVDTGFIYEIQIGLGKEHDFHLFKRTFEGTPDNVTYEVDLGYLGIDKVHKNSKISKKASKKHPLTEDEKAYNKEIAKERIFIEHTNSWIKRFKILSTKFRNHLKYFAPISVLICSLYNINISYIIVSEQVYYSFSSLSNFANCNSAFKINFCKSPEYLQMLEKFLLISKFCSSFIFI